MGTATGRTCAPVRLSFALPLSALERFFPLGGIDGTDGVSDSTAQREKKTSCKMRERLSGN